jgi:3-dehydroquinate dehydratase
MVKILLLQGANLTFLGRREPEIYGPTTPAELDAELRCHAHDHAYQLEIFYTNIEGDAINRIYQAVDEGFEDPRRHAPLQIARLTRRAIALTPKAVRLCHFARVA